MSTLTEKPAEMQNNILIVEDDMAIREMMAFSLRREGFDTYKAASGHEALEQLWQDQQWVTGHDLDQEGRHRCCQLALQVSRAFLQGLVSQQLRGSRGVFGEEGAAMGGIELPHGILDPFARPCDQSCGTLLDGCIGK